MAKTYIQVGKDVNVYFASGTNYHGLAAHTFASGTIIGFANNFTYDIDHGTEVYMAPGRRYGWGIKGGGIEVTLHLDGLWVDSGAQQFFHNEAERTGSLTAFAIGATGSDKGICFSGCRLSSLGVEFDSEGWCTQTVDIAALVPV